MMTLPWAEDIATVPAEEALWRAVRRLDAEIDDLWADFGGDPGDVRWPKYAEEYVYELRGRRDRLEHEIARLRGDVCACGACKASA